MAIWLAFAAILATGCGHEESVSDPAAAPLDTNASTPEISHAPVDAAPSTATVLASTDAEPDLVQMNRELRKWIVRNRRRPKNFEEFAAESDVRFPSPPAGKKYALDSRMHIVLVND